ncbi:MAG: hypothetical protein KME15_12500 [Drouetiella hepatica Uher 2000/2452]|jgi:hypothetical protein|uniref:Uncharacterized protein n=1 Tax=Drouetiella hepatica Uher 2000/2452 TaxID=904376 RepID=A0A951QB06_9CYAN|nr:hypothetical protein [Drouetiella hepatica Uher 2000/2452]
MFRKFLIFSMMLTLVLTTVACGGPSSGDSIGGSTTRSPQVDPSGKVDSNQVAKVQIADGTYPVQQASYDDINGGYTLMLLNAAPGQSTLQLESLQMARLTDEEIKAGQKSYLKVDKGQPVMHLTEDFRIEYIHNVTETQVNPQSGQQEVVVVRQEPSFWTPFAGALAGQAIGSLLFTPHYYFPPVYQPGVALTGYGGYGRTYGQAASNYQSRYSAPPVAVRNQQLRTTGQLRSPSRTSASPSVKRPQVSRPTGSGYGSTDLRRSNSPRPQTRSNRGFGSSRSRSSGRRR